MQIYGDVQLNKNEVKGFVIEKLSADPASGAAGQVYYNTTSNVLKFYNGTSWSEIGSGGGGNVNGVQAGTTDLVDSTTKIANLTAITGYESGVEKVLTTTSTGTIEFSALTMAEGSYF